LAAMDVWAVYLVARLGWLLLWSRLDVQGSYFFLAHPFVALVAILAARSALGPRGARTAAVLVALAGVGLAAGKLRATGPSVRAIAEGRGDEWASARRVHALTRDVGVLHGGAVGLAWFVGGRPGIAAVGE